MTEEHLPYNNEDFRRARLHKMVALITEPTDCPVWMRSIHQLTAISAHILCELGWLDIEKLDELSLEDFRNPAKSSAYSDHVLTAATTFSDKHPAGDPARHTRLGLAVKVTHEAWKFSFSRSLGAQTGAYALESAYLLGESAYRLGQYGELLRTELNGLYDLVEKASAHKHNRGENARRISRNKAQEWSEPALKRALDIVKVNPSLSNEDLAIKLHNDASLPARSVERAKKLIAQWRKEGSLPPRSV